MIDYRRYPPNWKTSIRPRILARARDCCEWCGIENMVNVVAWPDGRREVIGVDVRVHPLDPYYDGARVFRVILTVAHLDHDPENWDVGDNRLAALCQRCHLGYDRLQRRAAARAAEPDLFGAVVA